MFIKKMKLFTIMMGMMVTIGAGSTVASAAAAPESENLNVTFETSDTLSLALSSDTVAFGTISGMTETVEQTLTASVQSSLPYDLTIQASEDAKDPSDVTKIIPATKLGVHADGASTSYFTGINAPITLVADAPKTTALAGQLQEHQLGFKLTSLIGYDKGQYTVPLTVTATQK